ncbi:MAG: hypothetical protein ACRELG_26190 [Gemmataceae bacterium]
MFKKMMARRNFIEQVGAGVCAGWIMPGLAVADEKPARKRIKIGQIGVGHAHASKLSVYRASPDYEVGSSPRRPRRVELHERGQGAGGGASMGPRSGTFSCGVFSFISGGQLRDAQLQ